MLCFSSRQSRLYERLWADRQSGGKGTENAENAAERCSTKLQALENEPSEKIWTAITFSLAQDELSGVV